MHEYIVSPSMWREKYGLSRGAVFGLRHNLEQLSLLRPPFESRVVRGLYHVGASNRPGNGVPLVMIGAGLLADKLIRQWGTVTESG
jgi:phytoene dehydrogenase-like protein